MKNTDPIRIINKYYRKNTDVYNVLMTHSENVTKKALQVALNYQRKFNTQIDMDFIVEASMLHDIGIKLTNAPELFCLGKYGYIRHGYLGGQILRTEGLEMHARVAERHTGTGLNIEDKTKLRLPLDIEMEPKTIEEKIISYADLFYSKRPGYLDREEKPEEIIEELRKHGEDKARIFEVWHKIFTFS